ncbi:glycosyltransferase family 2 protein [Nocardiopsis sp. L17-MgMaSL7]|uniref:glycosyltransferase family 2 protein n=1 Tax=Nocardiopsis sp. L17-MgMaSL7 TaxID=1938893 RepID=UPI000D91C200|nr:glycosyltransferase [Nocardiopsis sp. L17-MgMaSL7]PWV55426.1 GT2 family glycosyltransferase [Nocardiopsis sp. L17-MgMaSL7]
MSGTDVNPRIGVVVITHNRRRELKRTLRLLEELPESPPIVVVDNASSDGTVRAVEKEHPGVHLIRSAVNLGAIGRNLGVEALPTPYVAFCDDDTWWEPGALERAVQLLDEHPRLGAITARLLVEPGGEEDPLTPELRHSPLPCPVWLPGPALLGVLAGVTVFRVEAFKRAGGFSSRLWLGGEEELLALDLAADGWWMCWNESMVAHHEASVIREPRRRRRQGIRNTLWTAWLRRAPCGAFAHTRAVLGSVPPDLTSALAVIDALAGLPWVLRERERVPAHVEDGLRLLAEPRRRSAARRYVD